MESHSSFKDPSFYNEDRREKKKNDPINTLKLLLQQYEYHQKHLNKIILMILRSQMVIKVGHSSRPNTMYHNLIFNPLFFSKYF